jgi:hypothetical protein
MTSADFSETGKQQEQRDLDLVKAKKPDSKPVVRKDGYLTNTFMQTKQDILYRVSVKNKLEHDWVAALIRSELLTGTQTLLSEQMLVYRKGYGEYSNVHTSLFINETILARRLFRDRLEKYIYRLTEEIISSLKRNIPVGFPEEDIISKVRAIFDSYEFRTRFIEDVEIRKSFNFGKVTGLKNSGFESFYIYSEFGKCEFGERLKEKRISLKNISLEDIPPFHAKCSYTVVKNLP